MNNMMIVEIAFNLLKSNLSLIRRGDQNIQLKIKEGRIITAMNHGQIAGWAK